MPPFRLVVLSVGLAFLAVGCRSIPRNVATATPREVEIHEASLAALDPGQNGTTKIPATGTIQLAQVESPVPESLEESWLVAEVESRNPTLEALAFAWQSASHRYPQAVALDDPMFMAMIAPSSVTSPNVATGYTLEAAQKLPWFGKRAARGARAEAEADMAGADLESYRLRLVELTRTAYYDYFLAFRQRELNRENLELVDRFRQTAQTKYRANQVTQQDVLQAEVELADLERQGLERQRMERIAVARINTLLREPPNAPLPPPVITLEDAPATNEDVDAQRQLATLLRPEVAAASAKLREAEAALALAHKEFFPDTEIFGRYDPFWEFPELRGQVGVRMNLPIYRQRLQAAYCEAAMRLNQRRAEYDQALLDVEFEVQSAQEQLEESRQTVELYRARFLPLAEQSLEAARVNYEAGQGTFLELLSAQRRRVEARDMHQQALATMHRRQAELERAAGGTPGF